jgi:hypothetical protein
MFPQFRDFGNPSAPLRSGMPRFRSTLVWRPCPLLRDREPRLERDPRYWEAFSEAQQEVADAIKGEAIGRAVRGWDEPVFYRSAPHSRSRRPARIILDKPAAQAPRGNEHAFQNTVVPAAWMLSSRGSA